MTDVFELETSIAPYVPRQFPEVYRANGPLFVLFLQEYYAWLGLSGNVGYETKSLMSMRDIDTTLPSFLGHFENKYLSGIPIANFTDPDSVRIVVKHIKSLVGAKGALGALQILFNILYGVDVDVYRPGDDLFKLSDNVWIQGQYMEVSYSPILTASVGSSVTGLLSGATAYVYDYERRTYPKNQSVNILFLDGVIGNFQVGEGLRIGTVANDLVTPYIMGSLNGIQIYQGGLNFHIGDELQVAVDPNGTQSSNGALAVVTSVTDKNGVVNFVVVDGGSLYANSTTDPSGFTGQTISITQDGSNPGAGATFEVGLLSNTGVINISNDVISYYAGIQLNQAAYGFPADPTANVSTRLEDALNIQNIEVGTIQTLSAINPGAGYTGAVTVTITNPVTESLHVYDPDDGGYGGNNAVISGLASHGEGAIVTVRVKQSGFAYVDGEHLSLSSSNNIGDFANGIAQMGSVGTMQGSWQNTGSFLDANKIIQDSYYFQDYSYDIRSSLSESIYGEAVKNITHVSGTQMFGTVKQVQSVPLGYSANLVFLSP